MSSDPMAGYQEYLALADGAEPHIRELIKRQVEDDIGLPMFTIDKIETSLHAERLTRRLYRAHAGVGDLTFAAFLRMWFDQPNHTRDLPAVVTALIPAGCFTEQDDKQAVSYAWTKPEFPAGESLVDAWLETFEYVGYVSDDDALVHPTDPTTLYRGGSTSHGLSWTSDPRTAHWFAYRLGSHDRHVWRATVEPAAVLARFDGRNESEFVIDPYSIPPQCIQVEEAEEN